MRNIILASKSPRRQELLKDLVSDFLIEPSSADEVVPDGTTAEQTPQVLAELKACDIAQKNKGDIVIGSDTLVIIDDMILTKPHDNEHAYQMLKMLSGRTHKVITGCAIVCDDKIRSFSVETIVEFYELSDTEINEYIKTGDCLDKAGAYGVQSFGKTLVKSINGDYFNVVGLPVSRLKRELEIFMQSLD